MKKSRLFIENFVVYGIGGIISKIIPLIMLPIITRLMPNSFYFGINDLSNTLVSFGSAIAILGMYDAMYRMFFENDDIEYKQMICSTTILFTSAVSIIVSLAIIILQKPIAIFLFGDAQYKNLLYLSAMSILIGSTNSIVSAPTRMQNKRGVYLTINTVSPILSYSISVPLLLKGYYIIALPVATVTTAFLTEIMFWIINKKWFDYKKFNKKYLKQMLIIAIPLVPNFLIYWIFNASDRLLIAKILGNDYVGIYAIGAKLGLCSQLIYTAFAGGWQYFAFATMKENNQVKTNSLIFEYLGIITFVASAFIMALAYPIYKLFFQGDYRGGYVVSGYLFMAPLLQMLFQVACNQFIIIKKTWPNAIILLAGAAINLALNFVLIPIFGIEGAAIATLAGYATAVCVCCIVLCKMKLMEISQRFILSVLFMMAYILVWRLFFREQWITSCLLSTALAFVFLILFKRDIIMLFSSLKKRNKE